MNLRYRVNDRVVVSEIIDGEAIIMNKRTGDYFSADGIASLLWQWVCEGHMREQMQMALAERFGRTPAEIGEAVDPFFAALVEHQLVEAVKSPQPPAANGAPAQPAVTAMTFAPPVLHVYTDKRDLMLLDPIHETDTELGWPAPKN